MTIQNKASTFTVSSHSPNKTTTRISITAPDNCITDSNMAFRRIRELKPEIGTSFQNSWNAQGEEREAVAGADKMATDAPVSTAGALLEGDHAEARGPAMLRAAAQRQPPRRILWRYVVLFACFHAAALYGAFLLLTSARLLTSAYAIVLYQASAVGVTAGAHRLWTHRAYKAKWSLRLILMLMDTLAFQKPIFNWVRIHRLHHKYTDTDADPHNASRGFFFSHVGWMLLQAHPDVLEKLKCIDMHDLEQDQLVMFQKKYYFILMPSICFIIPTIIPVMLWNETWSNAWFVATMLRFTLSLNMIWFVNSAAHMWGSKPYDKDIKPTENLLVSLGAVGEGWHNYHHVFPWDYKAAELGNYRANITTAFIDFFALIGWAYDLKTLSVSTVQKRVECPGDGSYDKNMPQKFIYAANRKTE